MGVVMATSDVTEREVSRVTVRVVVQQCMSAKLQVKPPSTEKADDAMYVEV